MRERRNNFIDSINTKFARTIIVPLISIFSLLIIAVIILVFSSFISEMRNGVINSKQEQLEYVERNVTSRLCEVYAVAYAIGDDECFSLNPIDDFQHSGYTMCRMLDRFLTGNDFISHLIYYRISEFDKYYTSIGEMSFHSFWNGVLPMEGYTELDYLDMIRTTEENTVLPVADSIKGGSYLVIINTIPQFTYDPKAYVIAYISSSVFDSISETLMMDCSSQLIIYDNYNNLIYQNGDLTSRLTEDELISYHDLADMDDETYHDIEIDGQNYLGIGCISSYNNWRYVSIIREDDVMSDLNRKQYSFLIFLCVLLMVSLGMTLAFVLKSYRPISRLTSQIMTSDKSNRQFVKRLDERVFLASTFERLMEEQKKSNRELFFANLLTEQYDETTYQYEMDEHSIHFEYPYFCVASVYIRKLALTEEEHSEMTEYIESYFDREGMECHAIFRTKPDHFILILNYTETALKKNNIQNILESMHEFFLIKLRTEIDSGVGNSYDSAIKMVKSQKEAISAMYYCSLSDETNVVCYSDIEASLSLESLFGLTSHLTTYVRQANDEEIRNTIRELKIQFSALSLSKLHIKYIAYNITASLLELSDKSEITDKLNELLSTLLQSNQIENSTFDEMEQLCIAIAVDRKSVKQSQKDYLIGEIKRTINEQLCDSMLSLDSIASCCNISSSYLSRFFKSYMGCTPMYYVESLRMDIVKGELAETDKSLKQILEETGYIDQSNFIRKFKRMEGITPMTYRKLHRSEQ